MTTASHCRVTGLAAVLAGIALSLSACSNAPEEALARAQAHLDNRVYRSAVVELKALLQQAPDDGRARWLLGAAYVDMEDGASAEKELLRARSIGVDEDLVAPLLLRSILLQGRFGSVIAFQPRTDLSPVSMAEIEATRSLAHLAAGDAAAAALSLEAARGHDSSLALVLFADAHLLFVRERLEEAAQRVDDLLRVEPGFGQAWSLLGDIRFAQQRYADAEDAYAKAMETRYAGLGDWIRRGYSRLARDDLDGALEDAEGLRRRAPKLVSAQYFAGVVYVRRHAFDKAVDVLQPALEARPRHFQTLYLLAVSHFNLGHIETARDLAQRAVGVMPAYVPARKLLATLLVREDKGAEAEALIRPVLASQPDDIEAKDILASSLVAQDRIREASQLLAEVAARRLDQPDAQARAGVGLFLAGRTDEGIEALNRATELAPGRLDVNTAMVETLLRDNAAAAALAAADRYATQRPDDPGAHNLRGLALLAEREWPAAEDAFAQAWELEPGNPTAARQLALLTNRRGEPERAAGYLADAVERHPDDVALRRDLAAVLLANGRCADAIAHLELALAADPGYRPAQVLLARILLTQDEPTRAARLLATIPGEDPAVLRDLVDAYLRSGQTENAEATLKRLIAQTPDVPGNLLALARIHAQRGDRERLRDMVDRVLALEPANVEGVLLKARLLVVERRFDDAEALLQATRLPVDDPVLLPMRLLLARARGDLDAELALTERAYLNGPVEASSPPAAPADDGKRAVAALETWVDGHPDDTNAMRTLSEMYFAQGDVARAAELLRRVVAREPQNVVAWNNLAWYLREQDPVAALVFAEQAYARAPAAAFVLDTYAEVLARNGQRDRAIEMIDRALATHAGNPGLVRRGAELTSLADSFSEDSSARR